jgi:hypothetical protein
MNSDEDWHENCNCDPLSEDMDVACDDDCSWACQGCGIVATAFEEEPADGRTPEELRKIVDWYNRKRDSEMDEKDGNLEKQSEEIIRLEGKLAALMNQFASLDSDYSKLKEENDANVETLAIVVERYNELYAASTLVVDNEVRYKAQIAKLKYKALKAQIAKS